jgi:hypothetical protein
LLQSILDRTSTTFSQSLQNSFQAARDQTNLQATQERQLLNTIRDNRNFAENQFRDRRDFDRGVLEDDRNFAQRDRQFNSSLAEQRAGRLQRRELAFAGLARDDRRLDLAEENARVNRLNTLSLIDDREARAAREKNEQDFKIGDLNKRKELEQKFLDLQNDPFLTDTERAEGLKDLTAEAQAFGIDNVAEGATTGISAALLPPLQQSRDNASGSTARALIDLGEGDLDGAISKAQVAVAQANQGGDPAQVAQAKAALKKAEDAKKNQAQVELLREKARLERQGKRGQEEFEELGFRTSDDALQVAFKVKDETGISKHLEITNSFNAFASQFKDAESFRNGIIAEAQRVGKGTRVKITKEQAERLFKAEKFLRQGSTPSAGGIQQGDIESAAEALKN